MVRREIEIAYRKPQLGRCEYSIDNAKIHLYKRKCRVANVKTNSADTTTSLCRGERISVNTIVTARNEVVWSCRDARF